MKIQHAVERAVLFGALVLSSFPAAAQEGPESGRAPAEVKHPRVEFTVTVYSPDGKPTPLGAIVMELFPEDAPKHTENFLRLVREDYYEGITFHRIVPGFIIQGGDPISKTDWSSPRVGTGGPAYTIQAEIGGHKHVRGAVAAARKPDAVNPDRESSGSQFYICLADLPSLDRGGYTVFGKVVQGMDVVDKIALVKNSGKEGQRALQRVQMTKVRVLP